jgi:hypothetical protein
MATSAYSRGVVGARPAVTCAICGRSILVGERPFRFTTDGREFVDVCPLCKDQALSYGWVSEGGPGLPVQPGDRQSRGLLGKLLGRRPQPIETMPEPILRRLSRGEQAIVEAATVFNLSPHRRTVEGLTRSLGWPTVAIVPLSGTNPEVVITVCWEISWYQYRVVLGSSQVRLAQRGLEPEDLEPEFRRWNAELNEAGLVVPKLTDSDESDLRGSSAGRPDA